MEIILQELGFLSYGMEMWFFVAKTLTEDIHLGI